jgi:hypothetical protein
MPEGEWAFIDSKGPRRTVTLRITSEAHLMLKAAGQMADVSPSAVGADVIERWAVEFLADHRDEIAELVKTERERRDDA